MGQYTEPPALVARAEDEESLVKLAEKYYLAFRHGIMDSMGKARRCGEILLKLKRAHRKKFTEWFKTQHSRFSFTYMQATTYMRIARHWDEVKEAKSVIEALRWLRAKKKKIKQIDGEENSETPSVNGRQKKDQDPIASYDWSWTRRWRSKSVEEKSVFARSLIDAYAKILLKKIGIKAEDL